MDTATPRKLPPTPDSYQIAEQTYHNGCHLLDPLIFTRCNNTRELYKPPPHGYERRDSLYVKYLSTLDFSSTNRNLVYNTYRNVGARSPIALISSGV